MANEISFIVGFFGIMAFGILTIWYIGKPYTPVKNKTIDYEGLAFIVVCIITTVLLFYGY